WHWDYLPGARSRSTCCRWRLRWRWPRSSAARSGWSGTRRGFRTTNNHRLRPRLGANRLPRATTGRFATQRWTDSPWSQPRWLIAGRETGRIAARGKAPKMTADFRTSLLLGLLSGLALAASGSAAAQGLQAEPVLDDDAVEVISRPVVQP